MFLRFFILLLSVGFIASCGMSGSEEDKQKTEAIEEGTKATEEETTATEEGRIVLECECGIEGKPVVRVEGDTEKEARVSAKKECPSKLQFKPMYQGLKSQLGDCKQINF